jgi:hypothetical protein
LYLSKRKNVVVLEVSHRYREKDARVIATVTKNWLGDESFVAAVMRPLEHS